MKFLIALLLMCSIGMADISQFKEAMLPSLVDGVPGILKSQDAKTGRFGDEPWIVNDQHPMYSLAVAWATNDKANPYYHSPELLTAIIKAGDALIAAQDKVGMFTFRKKDGSTWGQIYMPWTYSRWARAYSLTRSAFSEEARARWDKALTLAMEGIIKTDLKKPLENIPAYNATGVYCMGKLLNKPAWCAAATKYLHRIVDAQDAGGFWTEHHGPVMNYNFVYVDALGNYYGMSHDKYVLPALQRAAKYHAAFTYPDGTPVETVDERNSYEHSIVSPGLGFIFSAEGRGYMQQQYLLKKSEKFGTEQAASIINYGEDGPITPPPTAQDHGRYVMGKNDAMTAREGPWFACLSGYFCEQGKTRWIQDRQNFVSLFNDKTGLIVGGGNTKLQPLWSSFTAGDVNLLKHKKGDEDPNFFPPAGLIHVPSKIVLDPRKLSMDLTYGKALCGIQVLFSDSNSAKLIYQLKSKSDLPVEAHVTFLPHMGGKWQTASGKTGKLGEESFKLTSSEIGGWFSHHGWRVSVQDGASIVWPVLPHNQYVKDGSAKPAEGRIVLVMPLGNKPLQREIVVEIP